MKNTHDEPTDSGRPGDESPHGEEHRGEGPQGAYHGVSVAVGLVIALVVAGLVVSSVAGVSGDRAERYFEASAEWCDERDGELVNSQVIGPHGGLHCELPNGTAVHMSDVVDVNESDST